MKESYFFKSNNELTPSENQLNSLYRTFVFRKLKDDDKKEVQKEIDQFLSPNIDEKDYLINHMMKRLSMTTYQSCVPIFHEICKLPNHQQTFNFTFKLDKLYTFSGSIVSECKEFKNGNEKIPRRKVIYQYI